MPWVVKECGRRGAIGGVRGLVRLPGIGLCHSVLVSMPESAAWDGGYRSVHGSGRSRADYQRRCAVAPAPCARLVDRRVVWLGFSARPGQDLMLFNSYPFIFLFLPVVLLGYFALGRFGHLAPVIWLALASLVFYSVSNWQFVLLLLASVAFNYLIGLVLISRRLRAGAAICRADGRASPAIFWCSAFSNMPAFSPPISMRCFRPDSRRQHPAAGRDFLLHLHPDRLPGRRLPGQGRALCAAALRAVRHLFPASDRGADPASQGHDPAIRARRNPKRPNPHLILCGLIIFAIGLFKKTVPRRRHPAAGGAGVRPGRAVVRSGLDRRAGLYLPALFRFLRLFRHGDRHFADVRHLPAAEFQFALQGRATSSISGGAGT